MLRKSTLLAFLLLLSSLFAFSATLPKRTKLTVETKSELNSDRCYSGDTFETQLTQDLMANGKVVVPKGTVVRGIVSSCESSQGQQSPGMLQLQLISIETNPPHSSATSTVSRYGRGTPKGSDQMERRQAASDQIAGAIHDSVHPSPDSIPGVAVGTDNQQSASPQVFLPPGTTLTFTLRAPVEINPAGEKPGK